MEKKGLTTKSMNVSVNIANDSICLSTKCRDSKINCSKVASTEATQSFVID